MNLSMMQVLSESEIKQIHEATIDILTNCGVRIENSAMRDFLKSKGVSVDDDSFIVRFTQAQINQALSTVPASFDVFNRDGELAFTIGDGIPKVAAGHNAVFWADSESGRTRSSTVNDVECFARICEQLPNIDMIGVPVMPQDIPNAQASLIYGVSACVRNSKKPIFFSTDRPDVNRGCIELLRTAFKGDLADQCYGICQLSPTSPLYWESSVLEAVMDTVERGVPLAVLPEPNAGVSAPYTLAGLVTVNNAECLSGIIMIQMLKPGHKVLYANSWTTTDMRTGSALVGSVETSICRIAGTQLAKFYNIPCHTTAPNSDNHAHDEQNSWEKTISQLTSIASGTDLIVNCGMFATGMTCSHEQLVMDHEITAICRRLARGMQVDADTVALDVIKSIGPRGESYLTTDHTMDWLHSDEYYETEVSVRGPRATWEAAGCKDTYAVSREKAYELMNVPGAEQLSADQLAKMEEIVKGL